MKSNIFLVALLFINLNILAQKQFGIQGGLNLAQSQYSESSFALATKSKPGFIAGFFAEIPVGKSFYFRPELNFIQKGLKYSQSESDPTAGTFYSVDLNANLNYLDLPLHFVYMLPNTKVFLGAGPSVAFGLSGKAKYSTVETITVGGSTSTTSDSQSSKVIFDGKADANDSNGHLRPFDFGLGFIGGYKFTKNIVAATGYSIGLNSISPDTDVVWKNKGFFIKIGYYFSGK